MNEDDTPGDRPRAGTAAGESVDHEETVSLLQSLVGIESPYLEEAAIAEFVHGWLEERGHDPEYHAVSEPELTGFEGHNVVARLPGTDPDAPTLLLNAHMDTVEVVDAWEEDPFSGRIEAGRCYGVGAADMKAGLAAVMVAFDALADEDLAGEVLLTAVVDEEGPYGLGTDQLIRDGLTAECDAAIVTEPGPILATEDVANPALFLGARGRFLYDIEVEGQAAHASTPHRGTNAVVDAGELAGALASMPVGSHELLGDGSVCPLGIEGGGETLSVPERCRLLVDRHTVPGETEESALADAAGVVDGLDLDSSVSVGLRTIPHEGTRYGPYVVPVDHPFVDVLSVATRGVTGRSPTLGYFRSVGDFNYLGHRAGIPTVIVGPSGGNIHGAGEWVDIPETVDVARIVADAGVGLLA